MSAPVSGKFQDHYAILGVDPKAGAAAIQAAYAKLAEKYGPENIESGDPEKLEAVSLAFEVLSDPSLRSSFDKLKGIDEGEAHFSGAPFFEALEHGAEVRAAVLCILYDCRRSKPFKPSLSIRHLESMLKVTTDELNFALWYLRQRAFVVNDDKSSLQITVQGMDHLESNPPAAERVMTLIKSDAVPEQAPDSAGKPAENASKRGSLLTALNRGRAAKPSARPTAIIRR